MMPQLRKSFQNSGRRVAFNWEKNKLATCTLTMGSHGIRVVGNIRESDKMGYLLEASQEGWQKKTSLYKSRELPKWHHSLKLSLRYWKSMVWRWNFLLFSGAMLVSGSVILLVAWWRSPTKTSRCWDSGIFRFFCYLQNKKHHVHVHNSWCFM